MHNQREHLNIGIRTENKGKLICSFSDKSVGFGCSRKNIPASQFKRKLKHNFFRSSSILFALYLVVGLLNTSCNSIPKETAQATSKHRQNDSTAVDTAIAQKSQFKKEISYIGTTVPFQQISVRSRIEGNLIVMNVDVGDKVTKGYILGFIDETLLKTNLNQAEAELAALTSEVARANTQVSNALTEVERARLELQQATSDAQRQQKLVKQGAIAKQIAEQTLTKAQTAAQVLRLAEKQVQTERETVAAAKGRVIAQQAAVAQAKERKSYAKLKSPIAGVILEKMIEPGNLVQLGNEILKIGDFTRIKVEVQISELELAKLQIGQSVEVVLDAFPNQEYIGTLKRISPAANTTARLIPVEIVIPNIDGNIGSGLLARVNFRDTIPQKVIVPIGAIKKIGKELASNSPGTIFIVVEDGTKKTVKARSVTLGKKIDGKVEILSGLIPGETYVVRSSKPLKGGDFVRLSIISEPNK